MFFCAHAETTPEDLVRERNFTPSQKVEINKPPTFFFNEEDPFFGYEDPLAILYCFESRDPSIALDINYDASIQF